jgi:uncharacterized protein (TIGR02145 family)
MRYLLTSLLCVFTLYLTAQETGCTYQQADNFSPTATVDDGTCVFFCSWQPDSNSDGNVGTSDLLDFLSVFGDSDSDGDGVYDSVDECVDLDACNYQSNPTQACIFLDLDGDGVCDCGESVTHEGYDYSTVQIGDQCWFSENCRYLPEVSPSSAGSETSPYYYVNGYEGSTVAEAKATDNYVTYGVLYNWPAVMTEGICPSGWHIPSDGEWTQLTDFLGGESVAGGKMKEPGTNHWHWPNTGATNSSGFTGLPGGYWNNGFDLNGPHAHWWSTSTNWSGSNMWYRQLDWNGEDVFFSTTVPEISFSARCIKD